MSDAAPVCRVGEFVAAIRAVIQCNIQEAEQEFSQLIDQARTAREEPGCFQFECFRSTDFPDNLLRLELWESPQAFDSYRQAHLESLGLLRKPHVLQSPFHYGAPQTPRRHGQNGVEFYRYGQYERIDATWLPVDREQLPQTIRWPSHGAVRIVSQSASDPTLEGDRTRHNEDTRAEPGCLQYEQFRSIEFPVHVAGLELWSDPRIYDIHYLHRTVQRLEGTLARPPAPAHTVERVYGENGFEFYPHIYYAPVGGVWQPEEEAQRMVTVQWA